MRATVNHPQKDGRRHSPRARGMALLEVLLSVVILSTGLILVLRPFIGSTARLVNGENRLLAGHLIDAELWEAENEFRKTGQFGKSLAPRTLTFGDKVFRYRAVSMMRSTSFGDPALDRITARVKAVISWKTGAEEHSLVRVVHVAQLP